MAMNINPIVASVFQDDAQARRALHALREAGFRRDQIGYATQVQGQSVNLLDDLQNLGLRRENADYYDREFRAGRSVVSVRADGREQEAHDVLHQYGGYDYEHQSGIAQPNIATQRTNIDRTSAQYTNVDPTNVQNPEVVQTGARDTYVDPATMQNPAFNRTDIDERDEFYQPRRLQLREEQLNINKERVQSGEVGLRKEVVTEQQTIDVPVTHEEVYIERRPVEGGRVDATPIGEDETIRIPVSEEQVNVDKRTVVTGEVAIGKRDVEETRRVTDTVRREEARIDRQGNAPVQGSEDLQRRDARLREDQDIAERDQENRQL